jgi:heme/copper-type cytochrome/quinol oxidase subunit 4
MSTVQDYKNEGLGRYLLIYFAILVIAGLQFVVAYQHIERGRMFMIMLLLALGEAALGMLFFMHLWNEKRSLLVSVTLFILLVLAGLQYSWPDAFRIAVGAPFAGYH